MSKEAIQQDVSAETDVKEEGKTEVVNDSKRMSIMDEIANDARKLRDEQLVEEGQDVVDTSGEESQDSHEEEAEEKEEALKQEESENQEEDTEFETLVIDGKEEKFEREKILEAGKRALQKESTADVRLEEATRLLKEAQKQAQPSTDVEQEKSPSQEDVTLAKSIQEKIQYGTEEEAQQAINQLLQRGKTEPAINADDVIGLVRNQIQFENDKAWFQDTPPEKGGYSDLWQDPTLRQLVLAKESEYRDEKGDTRPNREVFTDIGNEVRAWRDSLVKDLTPKTGFEEKRQRKSKAGDTPKGAGGKQAPVNKESKPKTHEEKLDEMRKARHQL